MHIVLNCLWVSRPPSNYSHIGAENYNASFDSIYSIIKGIKFV